jgi:hypothetical protein
VAITQGSGGNFFGVTNQGGWVGSGVVFELGPKNFVVLHAFDAYVDGNTPFYALTAANDGNLYGVIGDSFSAGFIYEVTAGGKYTSLYNFSCCDGGSNPFGPLLQGTNGNLYGQLEYSAGGGSGPIFKLSNGIPPSVRTVPVAGKVGQEIIILGNGLTGSTSVRFNGTGAKFSVISDTEITATVPAGATGGTVSVVTPTGTLNSNPKFRVTK